MPCIPSLCQPGRRGGGRRWCSALTRTRRRSKARRDNLPEELGVLQRLHARELQPQVLHRLRTANAEAMVASRHTHQEVTGATSGIARKRLSPTLEGKEAVEKSSSAGSAARAFIARACRRAAPAAPAEVPSAITQRRQGKDEGGGALVGGEVMRKEDGKEEVAGTSIAASVALPSIVQAFSATPAAPATAAAETPSTSIERDDGKDGEWGEDRQEEEEKKEAEEDQVVVAEGRGKEEETEEEVGEMDVSFVDAVAARASIARASSTAATAATAAAAGAPSANVETGNQQGGEKGEDREEGQLGGGGELAGDTSVASPRYDEKCHGSPVPAEFRPEGHKDNVLSTWGSDFFNENKSEKRLGSGAFGAVYRVWTKAGIPVAKKVMRTHTVAEKRYAINEVDLIQACAVHPSIVDVFGVIQTPTEMHLLMPEVPCNLAGLIKHIRTEHIRLDEDQAINIVRQLMSALEFLHGHDIVHRDIKPSNVLLRGSEIYLADFGLAIAAPDGIPSIGNECGTLPYMAPEVFQGQVYGSGVDVWAVGVTLYELFHQYLPFTDEPDVEWENGGGGGRAVELGGGGRAVELGGGGRAVELGGGSGSVSESSGSVVTGCSKSQENLKANIVRGEFRIDTSLAGERCRDFISQLLSRDPRRRPTAVQAEEHPWLGETTTIQTRRLTAKLAVATNTAKRVISAVQRLQARVQPSSDLRGAAGAAAGSSAVLKATEAATSAVAELDQVVVVLHEGLAMGEDVEGWEEKAAAEGAKGSYREEKTTFRMAEDIARTIEMYAREALTPVALATAAVDSWEKVVRQNALPSGLSRARVHGRRKQ